MRACSKNPRSAAGADFGPVRSSKAARLSRISRATFGPPARPVFVPGLHWLGLIVLGPSGPPPLAAWRWWTSRGPHAATIAGNRPLAAPGGADWRRQVIHLFDRGFAGAPGWADLSGPLVRFVLRWPKRLLLRTLDGQQRPAWQAARGQRSWGDVRVVGRAPAHLAAGGRAGGGGAPPGLPGPGVMAGGRRRRGQEPWYLLTNEAVDRAEAAWAVVRAYARRWQIEQTWRYCKSELGFESVRVWGGRRGGSCWAWGAVSLRVHVEPVGGGVGRVPRLAAAALGPPHRGAEPETAAPLYRMRAAISRLWSTYRPPPLQLRA